MQRECVCPEVVQDMNHVKLEIMQWEEREEAHDDRIRK